MGGQGRNHMGGGGGGGGSESLWEVRGVNHYGRSGE